MPIYEFQCQACGTEIEVLQKINDPHLTDCEACGKAEMKKKVTAAAFRLSGAGWYETDFKKENDKKKNLTESVTDNHKDKKSSDNTSENNGGTNTTAKDSSDKSSDKSTTKAGAKSESTTKESSKPNKDKTPSSD
jgi:putative FmdB family regulatory protein